MNWTKTIINQGCILIYVLIYFSGCKEKSTIQSISVHKVTQDQLRTQKSAVSIIEKTIPIVKQGDLILRTGNDFTSESLRQMSHFDKTYSHCGIASYENDTLFVYHALGGDWNPDEKLRRDRFELFCNPKENRGFGVYTYKLNNGEIQKLDSVIKSWYKKSFTFDMNFDLATDEKLYCAEFVSKAINKATDGRMVFDLTRINNFIFIAIDNLFNNDFCTEKTRVRFNLF